MISPIFFVFLQVTNNPPTDADLFPPERISDLTVESSFDENDRYSFVIEFTSPGDDFYNGTGT